MKLTNLIDNVNKQNLSIISSVCNWFNGLLIGSLAATVAWLFLGFWAIIDKGFDVKYEFKKKK